MVFQLCLPWFSQVVGKIPDLPREIKLSISVLPSVPGDEGNFIAEVHMSGFLIPV
jgi:hypothetical protein